MTRVDALTIGLGLLVLLLAYLVGAITVLEERVADLEATRKR